MSVTFRALYKKDLAMRVLDLVLHVIAAIFLPGPWWFQFLPDICVPFLFVASWKTDKLLRESNPLVTFHKALHTVLIPGATIFCMFVLWKKSFYAALLLQWSVHLAIDLFTHAGTRFQKSLWPQIRPWPDNEEPEEKNAST